MVHRIEEVVERGMCVGCGGCGAATSGAIPVTIGRLGVYQASLDDVSEKDRRIGSRVCPFSDESADEDALGAPQGPTGLNSDPRLGQFSKVAAGRRSADRTLAGSSSGGLTSWTLTKLLEGGQVDGVIHVGSSDSTGGLFQYVVSESLEEIDERRKSQYYSTSMDQALLSVRGNGRRYAIVGVPCFISAARRVCQEDSDLGRQITFFVGIVCGHLKSQFFPESFAWQLGVPPDNLASVDFRVKNAGRPAWDYDFAAIDDQGAHHQRRNLDLLGANWGHGALQPEACNFCDDIFAETADVVFGDAWMPGYQDDWRGTNVLVSRNLDIDRILDTGVQAGEITLDDVDPAGAAASQAGNFRHRRTGLSVRLADDIARGLSVPVKRVAPDPTAAPLARRLLIRQRRRMSRISLIAFARAKKCGDLAAYLKPMRREVLRYKVIDKVGRRLTRR